MIDITLFLSEVLTGSATLVSMQAESPHEAVKACTGLNKTQPEARLGRTTMYPKAHPEKGKATSGSTLEQCQSSVIKGLHSHSVPRGKY